MSDIMKTIVESQLNSVEHRHSGSWPVYGDYDRAEHEEEGKRSIYVVRSDPDPSKTVWYRPLHDPEFLLEFADLFDRPISSEEAAPIVLYWVKRYGALGANHAYSEIESRRREWSPPGGLRMKVHGMLDADHAYPDIDTTFSRRECLPSDDIQWVDEFVMHSVIANRCWRLLAAAKAPGGPDAEKLRELLQDLDVKGDTPAQLAKRAKSVVDAVLNFYLRRETCMERYYLGDGKSFRGPGVLSLLGALYLQMSNFRDAEDITYCKWCGKVVNFEQGEPTPSDAPKGARGKHKTHKNREYCKEWNGVKDHCKNQFNYEQRKKAHTGS
jgi:hypothetical protein